uniref:Small integral membrane protein 32 n=1 Tax=Neolamprologus brichardi TaxID=32507 RepID=A0A3Q4GLP0_NEOBR
MIWGALLTLFLCVSVAEMDGLCRQYVCMAIGLLPLQPTTGRGGGGLREGELHKPDLITYIVMCLLLFLLVLLIVFFINCQLRNSFFASMPYDRSLREARTSYK